ncbi:MAG TPA: hypothetical protein VEA37_04185, partial [Flavobacterium sp.]|nr:hypothetical protein [Flavobacterium sp.]
LNNQLQSSFNTLDEAETAGAKPIKDFYQIAARRLNDSKNSISTKQFVDKTLRQFGVKIKAGEQAPKGWGVHAVSTTETVNGKVRPKVEYYALPRQIADELNDLNKVDDGALEKVGRGYDKYFMAPWKALATAANPGFHVRNALSNQWQNYLDVGAKVFNPIEQAKALFLPVMKNVKVGDKTYSGKELIDVMKQQGVLNQGWIGKDLPTYIDKELKHGLKTLPGKTLDLINPLGQNFAGRKVGNAIENQAATFNFMQNLKKNGGDIKEAASHRDKFLFDYGDLTNFERKVMRRAVPFYTWMRKNIPLQAEQMIKQPGKYATIPKGINAIENQSDPVNETWLPEYMKGYIKTPLGSKDKPIYWNPNMPWQDLEKLNAKELPKTLIPSLTPPLKAAVELGMNKNFFFNDEIEKKRYNYDTEQIETLNVDPPDYLLALPDEYKEKLGLVQQTNKDGEIEWKMSPKSRYLLQQLPFIENASKGIKELKGLPSGETDKKGALHLLSWLGGIKGAEYDIEKQKSYTMSTQAREQGINQTTLDEMLSTLTKQGVSKDKAYDIILNTKSNKLVYKYPYGKGLESFKQSLNLLASQGVNPQKAYELLLNNKPLSTYKTDSGTTQEITYKTLLKLGMEPSSAYQMIVEEYPLTALQTKTLEALVDRGYTPEDAYGMLMEKRDRDRANRENEKPKPPKEWQIESAIRNLNK